MAASTQNASTEVVLEEWRELESDPGVFSLLIEDYGVRDIKVEEIYDVSKKIETTKVYGFVFLFRFVLTDRRSRKAARNLIPEDTFVLEAEIVNEMFFAHQIINNSCATHALLSVLLNVKDLDLGPTLTKLKDFSKGLDPESKGLAITNMVELAHVHNKYAKPTHVVVPPPGKRACVLSSAHALLPETYHFVSFVPINDRLFELDGLKEFPIDHGPWGEHEQWTDLFQRIISSRLAQTPDLLFNLLAIVPDPIPKISERLKVLHEQQNTLLEEVSRIANKVAEREVQNEPSEKDKEISTLAAEKGTVSEKAESSEKDGDGDDCQKAVDDEDKMEVDQKDVKKDKKDVLTVLDEVARSLPTESEELLQVVSKNGDSDSLELDSQLRITVAKVVINNKELETWTHKLKEELETKQRYQIEHSRRTHDYDPFISEFIKMLAQNGQLPARLMKRPTTTSGVGNNRRKNSRVDQNTRNKKQRTTLLVNGAKVN